MKKFVLALALMLPLFAKASPAEDYFKQFIYQVNVDEKDPENPVVQSRFLMTKWDQKTVLPNGDALLVNSEIFLLENHTYVAFYHEQLSPKGNPNALFPHGCKKIEGTWSVPADRLVLSGYASGGRAVVNGQNGVEITFEEQIISPEGRGFKTPADYAYGNMRLEDMRCMFF